MEHPISESSLNRFANGTATREEGRRVLAHLLRGCSVCSQALQERMGPAEQAPVYQEALGTFRKNHLTVR
jgi:hypothetical protein